MDLVLFNIIGLFFVIGIIWGIKLMSSPETAVRGNLIGSICMLGAIILTLIANNIINLPLLWMAMIIGGLIGSYLALKVAMIQMPQMVALLNGFGGGASSLVSMVVLFTQFPTLTSFSK